MEKYKKQILLLLGGLGLYLVSAGFSYVVFSSVNNSSSMINPKVPSTPAGESKFKVDVSGPKTQECPLNGEKFTKAEQDIWSGRRPLLVMIENHSDARPQSGVFKADIVYEAVAEGGITRFMGVFYCGASSVDWQVGPVRSARTYFLDFASEYGDFPLYAHVGGANTPGKANALGQIGDYGWLKKGNDMNQFALGFPVYWRDETRQGHPVATEHTMYSTMDKLWGVAEKRNLTNVDSTGVAWDKTFVNWGFKDETGSADRGSSSPSFSFWKGYSDYDVKWQYDSTQNLYTRNNGGTIQKDHNDQSLLTTKNVVVVFMAESRANDGYENNLHLLYSNKGTGKALIFQAGKTIEGIWNKKDRKSRTIFKDLKGKEIKFERGKIWIEILPAGSEVKY